jgi:ketosteroid isomerase-like protein
MFVTTTVQRIEGVIRTYVEALNDADDEAIAACFCPDAAHYFPAAPKLSGRARDQRPGSVAH